MIEWLSWFVLNVILLLCLISVGLMMSVMFELNVNGGMVFIM